MPIEMDTPDVDTGSQEGHPMQFAILPLSAIVIILSGCGMTESRVREQVTASEARSAAAQAQLEDRMLARFTRAEQTAAVEAERMRRELETQGDSQRRLVIDVLVRQRDTLMAQARELDASIAAMSMPRPLAAGVR